MSQMISKKENTLREKARAETRHAIKTGALKKPLFCPECGSEKKLEPHHPDYGRPLLVHWLCQKCHREKHKGKQVKKEDMAIYDATCLYPFCNHWVKSRGLCASHYSYMARHVKQGKITWTQAIARGKCTSAKPGRKATFQEWLNDY